MTNFTQNSLQMDNASNIASSSYNHLEQVAVLQEILQQNAMRCSSQACKYAIVQVFGTAIAMTEQKAPFEIGVKWYNEWMSLTQIKLSVPSEN